MGRGWYRVNTVSASITRSGGGKAIVGMVMERLGVKIRGQKGGRKQKRMGCDIGKLVKERRRMKLSDVSLKKRKRKIGSFGK